MLWNSGEKSEKKDKGFMEQWEYIRFVFDSRQSVLDLGENRKLPWNEMWDFFNQLGNEGWEMLSVCPFSSSAFGHAAGDTNRILFVFKKKK